MNSELKILKTIWKNNKEASIRLLSRQTGLGIDYTRYICSCLCKKNQIEPIKGRRDWYQLTSQGKKTLKLRGILEPEIAKRASEGELIRAEEKRLNLGKAIEKAVSYLRNL